MTMFIMIPRSAPCTAKRMNQARAPADTAIQQYKCIHPVVLCVENEERQAATHDQWGWHIYASGYNVARHSCSHERPSQPHIRWNSSTGCSRSFYCYVLLNTQNSFYHRARENTQHRTHSAHTHTHIAHVELDYTEQWLEYPATNAKTTSTNNISNYVQVNEFPLFRFIFKTGGWDLYL